MKKEYFLIGSFLLVVGLGLFSLFNSKHVTNATAIAAYQINQILSPEFVEENILSASGDYDDDANQYVFNNEQHEMPLRTTKPLADGSGYAAAVLGSTSDPKKLIVDLSHQRVYAYEGDRMVFNFLVSTGKWGATPTGSYRIWYKVRSQVMKGGSKELGTYYYLPNVQWIQYFNKGIGFHSTYWHNNFGTPMSHGCINMTTTDSETLYHWATPEMPSGVKIFRSSDNNPGTPVEVVNSWTL